MIMSWVFAVMLALSIISAAVTGQGAALASAVTTGAQSGITLVISIAGALCLWSGVGRLLEASGVTQNLARLLRPLLRRIFPGTRSNPRLARHLSANLCANLLGLGNAATPMGILAAKEMTDPARPGTATDEMCRLIVLNTASIQLIPANVAAVRSALGCSTPFDILPAVWLTSLCSAAAGVAMAWCLGKLWRDA